MLWPQRKPLQKRAFPTLRVASSSLVRRHAGVGHFDIYHGPEFEVVVADEVEFLRRHLLSAIQASAARQRGLP
jgi:hypothetical protein